jgi:S1-C subfamily serine protease
MQLFKSIIVPCGPASEFLEEGDVLLKVNGDFVTKFVPLETILDDSVGKNITVEISRGGILNQFQVRVQDLHSM